MNKKEAIAYGQIAFESMMHSDFKGELSVANFGIEMKQCFKLYSKDVAVIVANNIIETEKEILSQKNQS